MSDCDSENDKYSYISLEEARAMIRVIPKEEFYWKVQQVESEISQKNLDITYLHYLCATNQKIKLRVFLRYLQGEYPNFHDIINDHNIYDFWYGTPLHTAVSWNNDVDLVKLLINYGADPYIKDYYGHNPFQGIESLYVNPFSDFLSGHVVESEIYGSRKEEDFKEVITYYQGLPKSEEEFKG